MLRVENLRIGDSAPLSFEVKEGECLAIQGPSGSGKTRLLRAIADLDDAPGLVVLNGALRNEMEAPRWRQMVRYVAAEPGWWTDTPRPAFPDTPKAVSVRKKLMHALNLGPELLDRPIAKLSTGERLRLAFVRALIDEPRALLLDEPTASLDPTNAALVEELIRYQLLSGKIVLLVSHNQAQIDRLADKTLKLAAPQKFASPAKKQTNEPTERIKT